MIKRLIDDCFVHDGKRMRHDSAVALLRQRIAPTTDLEAVDLFALSGRIAGEPIDAPFPVPNHTNAAVDGYAFNSAHYDPETGTAFAVTARAAAGHAMVEAVPSGAAVRIFTGAALPAGVDTVAMQEDCASPTDATDQSRIYVPGGLKPGANVRPAGEDVAAGMRLVEAGQIIRPQDLAALASIGRSSLLCHKRPVVGFVSTGDEVVRAGAGRLQFGQVYDANAPMLHALIATTGAMQRDLGVWPDDAAVVEQRLAAAAAQCHVVITTGGASLGEEDHMTAALARLGTRHFWQLQIKPGRPMMFGQVGDTVIIGLPGNPVAVFVCFLMYVWPMLRRLSGAAWPEPLSLIARADFEQTSRKIGRREFWRGHLKWHTDGLAVSKYPRDGSGLISSLRAANCLIDIPEDMATVSRGSPVRVIPFTAFGIQTR